MKKIIFIIFFSFYYIVVFAQWTQVNSGTSHTIRDMYFQDSLTGVFISSYGEIYRTIDGGNNWTEIFQDFDFSDTADINYPNHELNIIVHNDTVESFVAMGNNKSLHLLGNISTGIFIQDTLDLLVQQPEYWNNEIWYVQKVNEKIGIANMIEEYAIYGDYIFASNATKMFYSTNMGTTWIPNAYTEPSLSSGPYYCFFNGSDTLIAISQYPTIIHVSYNGGNSWSQFNSSIDGLNLLFLSSSKCIGYNFLMPQNMLFYSVNGGNSFITYTLSNSINGYYKNQINNNFIFIYGREGMIYKTTSGGETTSIDNPFLKKNLKIYPNPAIDKLFLQYQNNTRIISINLLDAMGRTVKIFANNFEILDISEVAKGNYWIVVNTGEGSLWEKVVIQ